MNATSQRSIIPFSYVLVLFLIFLLLAALAFFWRMHQLQELWFYDDVEHVLGGVFLFVACCYVYRHETEHMSRSAFFFLCLGFVALWSIFWEAGWFYVRKITTGNPEYFISLEDTITDLLYDLCGGLIAYAGYVMRANDRMITSG